LKKIREALDERPDDWRRAVSGRAFRSDCRLEGESLKRPPRGFAPEHPLVEDLKRKDFIAVRHLDPASIHGPGFLDEVTGAFSAAGPFMAFLCRALGTPT
jgi:uncharacterized protein (TIGR02453 family)